MTPDSSIDLALLGRYLDGTASAGERAAVDAWIGTAPERREAVRALHAAWSTDAGRLGAPYDADAGWAGLLGRLGAPRAPKVGMPAPARWTRIGLAAAVLLAVGAGAEWWLSSRRPAPHPVAEAPAMREYAAPRGRRAVFRLLDGTEITLNADSRLRAAAAFGGAGRDVYLDGEAYFTVVHDSTRPFLVHTGRGVIRDVGTRFGVRAYSDGAAERVAVVEGSVAVAGAADGRGSTAETPLRAGQVAAISRAGQVDLVRGASADAEVAWTTGRLVFRGVPLAEVVRRIERWYDLDLRIASPELAGRPVTGSYSNEPISEVLSLITAAVGARYEWRGRTVVISPADGPR